MKPLISIIIPIYNVEAYLRRCLDSIKNQSFTNFECILINDGSTDSSKKICEEYLDDSRFVLINTSNGGPSRARNIGLEKVSSDWVTFIDSDDYVEPNYLSAFVYNCKDFKTQIIQGYYCFGYDGEEIDTLYKGSSYKYKVISKGIFTSYFKENNIIKNWAVWCKLFSMEIIKKYNLRFEESLWCGEDGVFWHKYLCYIDTIIFIPDREYIYFCPRNFNSVSRNRATTYKEWYVFAREYKFISNILPQKFFIGLKNSNWLKMYYLNNYFKLLLKSSPIEFDEIKKIRPSKNFIVWTFRGLLFFLLNILPISLIKSIRLYK